MKINKKDLTICFMTFAGTLFLLWLFLILSASIPNAKIQDNMVKSALVYAQEDAFSYCDGENIGLYLAVSDEQAQPNTDYTRYWHGTAGCIRLLHLFTDVNGIKNFGLLFILLLAVIILFLLLKEKNALLAAAFVISLCIVKVWNIRLSMEYQPAFVICFLMCILYLLFEKKGDTTLLFLSVVGGVLIAFFDFLTTETMVILLPLIFVITIRAKEKRKTPFVANMRFVISQFVAWGLAYAASYLIKWSAVSILTEENKFAAALQSVGERIGGPMSAGGEMNQFEQIFAAPAANISVLMGAQERIDGILLMVGLFLIVSMILIGMLLLPEKEDKNLTFTLLILGSIVILRYLVLSNHSYMHAFFTYRGMISLIMALFSIWIIHFNNKNLSNQSM